MRKYFFTLCLSLLATVFAIAQQTSIRGKLVDGTTKIPVPDAEVFIQNTNFVRTTNAAGEFVISDPDIPLGEEVLVLQKSGYETQLFPIIINVGQELDLGMLYIYVDVAALTTDVGVITLSDEELDQDEGSASNISGLLQSSKDAFLQAAAFDFSATFFKPRGYDSEYGKVLINGIEMNKMFNGRPQWSNWGGLNDLTRNQVFTQGLSASDYNFGGLAGSTNIIMRASQYREGGSISYASANASYIGRMMASYSTGLMQNGWAVSVMASRRFANEGYNDGTLYDSNSYMLAVEKKINDKHSLNFTGFLAQNRRGKSSASTQEVYDMKGIRYNSYWGRQYKNNDDYLNGVSGKKRNSRIREIEEPIFMLNHNWDFNETTNLSTNVSYQFGKWGDSRLGYDNATNPDPTYYQNLPSYFLGADSGPNYELAENARNRFINDGQIDWNAMYYTNIMYGGTSRYYLYEDRNDDKQFAANTIFTKRMDNITFNAALNYRNLDSHNFARMLDVLGGNGYLDVDSYNVGDKAQSDLNNPDRIIGSGEKFKYNYKVFGEEMDAFVQAQFKYRKIDFYLAAEGGTTNYQREGLYRNGAFADDSYGKSKKLDFTTFGGKGGLTYKITGRHLLDFNAAYYTQAPTIRNSFSNSRQNNQTVRGLTEETIMNVDASYIFRSPTVKGRLTGYYTKIEDASQISFFYADGISGLGRNQTNAFVQEVLTNVDKEYLGAEFGVEVQVTPTIKLKSAAAVGQHIYANNPDLYLTSDDFEQQLDYGKSYLKNYKLAGGPQRAYQAGIEYRDPKFWWVGATANYFTNSYVDVAPIARTQNFYMDSTGFPFSDYDEDRARELLAQEKFKEYTLVNLTGGKSWRVNGNFIGVFASINNVFNQKFKTGGFEQGRNANYKTLNADVNKETRVFGNKYWYGNGTTYYVNVYFRF